MIRVPVFRTILGTYFFIWYQRGEFLLLAIPTIVVIVFLGALGALAVPEIPTGAGRGGEIGGLVIALGAILGVLFTAASVMFSVAWHRRYLVPDEPANVHTALRWGRRQTRFLLLAIGLAVLSAGVFLVGGLVGSILGLFIVMGGGSRLLLFLPVLGLFVLVGLIYARLSLLFPSTAVDHRMSFGECGVFTRGNGWRLFIIIFLVAIPFSLIASLIGFPLGNPRLSGSLMDTFFRVVVYATFWFIGIAVGVSALSIAYNELMTPRQVASPGGMVMPTIPFPATMLLAEGLALHLDGQHERAIRTLRQSLERSQNAVVHARLAAVYADVGRIDEAEEEIKLILEKNPDAMVEDFLRNFQDPKRAEWYAGLLKGSGLPE